MWKSLNVKYLYFAPLSEVPSKKIWTKCQANELLYIGDSIYDMQCAKHANVNFGLAKWGAGNRVNAQKSFCTPFDLAKSLASTKS